MLKIKYSFFLSLLLFISVVSSGCANLNEEKVTISIDSESEYVNTFKDLNLGILFDFTIKIPNADNSWVTLWAERYIDGVKESQPLTQLSYGNSPNKVEEGHLGFGIFNPYSEEETLVFLYGPGVRTGPSLIESKMTTGSFSNWDYAIGKDKVELTLGETKTLAVYRESVSGAMQTANFQDEDSLNEVIQQDYMVILLKIKVEERSFHD